MAGWQINVNKLKYWTLSFILIFFCIDSVAAVIRQVRIQGQKEVTQDAIRGQIKTRAGRRFRSSFVTEDVKRLYEMGYFSHISVDSYKDSKNRRIVTFKVKEKPRIKSITYKGHNSLSTDKLKELSDLKEYEFINIEKLKTAIQNIKNQYIEKGYFLAQVSYSLKEDSSTRKADIVIDIQEGEKASIKKISFIGNNNISSSRLKSFLSHKEKSIFSLISDSGIYKEENLSRDLQIIKLVYMEQGYMDVQVDEPQISLSPSQDSLYITFSIREGSKFKVGNIDFSGDLIFPKIDLQQILSLKTGDVFSYSSFQRDLISLQNKYGDKGHAFANVIPRFASVGEEIHVLFQIEKGQIASINRINIVGNDYTRDRVIRREIKIFEGDTYNSSLVSSSQGAIQRLGYFDDVSIFPQPTQGESHKVDLEVLVKERETYGEVGGGVSYRQNAEDFWSWDNLGLNASLDKKNIFGLGRNVRASLNLNFATLWFNGQYVDPHILDSDWYLSLELFYENSQLSQVIQNLWGESKEKNGETEDDSKNNFQDNPYPLFSGKPYLMERRGVQFALGRWFKDQWKIVPKVGFTYMNFRGFTESLETGVGSSIRDNFNLEASKGFRVSLGGALEHSGKNDPFFPTKGVHTRLASNYIYRLPHSNFSSLKILKSDWSFSHYVNLKDLLSIGTFAWSGYLSHVTLKNKIQIGAVYSLGSKNSFVPVDLLYLLGGPLDLRGYSLLSVGKTISVTRGGSHYFVPYGGNQQLMYNLELQFPILLKSRLYGVLFFDFGQADDFLFSKTFKKGWSAFKKDVGMGVSWASPFGPIHLKLGFPIEKGKDLVKDREFHFNIGYDF